VVAGKSAAAVLKTDFRAHQGSLHVGLVAYYLFCVFYTYKAFYIWNLPGVKQCPVSSNFLVQSAASAVAISVGFRFTASWTEGMGFVNI
jgi:hypothetical protein